MEDDMINLDLLKAMCLPYIGDGGKKAPSAGTVAKTTKKKKKKTTSSGPDATVAKKKKKTKKPAGPDAPVAKKKKKTTTTTTKKDQAVADQKKAAPKKTMASRQPVRQDDDDDEVDRLFDEDAEPVFDPSALVKDAEAPDDDKGKEEAAEEQDDKDDAPLSEKELCARIASSAGPSADFAGQEEQEKKKNAKPRAKKQPKRPRAQARVTFPHADDLARMREHLWMCIVSLVATGQIAPLPGDVGFQVDQLEERRGQSMAFCMRFLAMREQLLARFQQQCEGNPYMEQVAGALGRCKLTVLQQPKTAGPYTCCWTGQVISDESNVRECALTPLRQSWSHSGAVPEEGDLPEGAVFHLTPGPALLIRCTATALFFLDYLNAEVTKLVRQQYKRDPGAFKPDTVGGGWTAELEQRWRVDFTEGNGRKWADQQLAHLHKCCSMMARAFSDECMTVVS